MIVQTVLIVHAIKLMFIPLYRSTDFEVHRNWLAITHNLTVDKWYYDNTSEWTLDYPPFFAWFEYGLSHLAAHFDTKMLLPHNLNYDSPGTVIFQRLSVIIMDIIYIIGAKRCSDLIANGKLLAFLLLLANPGLLMVDHIHFQYNGFLYGLLLLSVSNLIKRNHLASAFWFAVLLNFKHIFLYIAPVYVVYMLRAYCFTVSSKDGIHVAWYSFSISNLIKLATTVLCVFGISFGPFISHLPQILTRLFPFKRGLCHAYWAPNFWALYNMMDKLLVFVLPKFGFSITKPEASMTGGLVQEFEHSALFSIKPVVAFILTAVSMLPALIHMWHLGADKNYRAVNFVRCIIICSTCSFMFGWHVHEKAILMTLIPLSFMSVLGDTDGKLFLFLSIVGHYSLFPLLYPSNLLAVKIFMLLTHSAIGFSYVPSLYDSYKKMKKDKEHVLLPMFDPVESVYMYGFAFLCFYEHVIHSAIGLDKTLPFLPLMMTSVYCAIGVLYFWLQYYYYFLTFQLSASCVPSATQPVGRKTY